MVWCSTICISLARGNAREADRQRGRGSPTVAPLNDREELAGTKPVRSGMTATLSICVPTLNTFPFLRERFDSLFRQSFHDWDKAA